MSWLNTPPEFVHAKLFKNGQLITISHISCCQASKTTAEMYLGSLESKLFFSLFRNSGMSMRIEVDFLNIMPCQM